MIFFYMQDSWLYHLTVVSGAGPNAGTQYEQLVQKLMEVEGDPSKLRPAHDMLCYFLKMKYVTVY